jgi:hypothetical protein
MGIVENISHDKFPKQGRYIGQSVSVCFNYDTSKTISGKIVRDDAEAPGLLIIQLDDDRFVLATECMYSLNSSREVVRSEDGVTRSPPLVERLCQSLAFHLIESELTLSHAEGEDLSYWTEECSKARALIKEAGFDIDVLYPILDRPTCTEPQ